MSEQTHETRRRRTFAIISHPDAGKTTLTEKLLLFGGAIQMAGSVKGRKAARHATSDRSEEHTSELQSLMRISYAVFCLKKKNKKINKKQQLTRPSTKTPNLS